MHGLSAFYDDSVGQSFKLKGVKPNIRNDRFSDLVHSLSSPTSIPTWEKRYDQR